MSDPDRVVVHLVSSALFVGTSADGTGADTDVVTDEHGLPYLPRHRLAARLRAGARSAPGVAPGLAGVRHEVFGRVGSHDADRKLRVGHAVLGDEVRSAVARALAGRAEPVRSTLRRAVTDAYTTLEASIEVGRDGVPEPGRLRTNRVLLPGLVLTAALTWATPPGDEHWRLLARACLATDQIGLKATRGRGRVDVRLARADDPDPDATTLLLAAHPDASAAEKPGRAHGREGTDTCSRPH